MASRLPCVSRAPLARPVVPGGEEDPRVVGGRAGCGADGLAAQERRVVRLAVHDDGHGAVELRRDRVARHPASRSTPWRGSPARGRPPPARAAGCGDRDGDAAGVPDREEQLEVRGAVRRVQGDGVARPRRRSGRGAPPARRATASASCRPRAHGLVAEQDRRPVGRPPRRAVEQGRDVGARHGRTMPPRRRRRRPGARRRPVISTTPGTRPSHGRRAERAPSPPWD